VLEHLEQERPSHRVKGLRQIDLEQNRGVVFGMEPTTGELYFAEILVDTAALDERGLVDPDNLWHAWRQTPSKRLGEQFANRVD
jgi:hypothetical protein